MSPRRSVTIVSPHFDDAPLSLGQSLRDGVLADCDVRVRIVFGRTNWTNWMHPTAARAVPVSWWRRVEETLAARAFGYRWTAARWEEAFLRWGGPLDHERLLDLRADLSDEPLVEQLAAWLRAIAAATTGGAPDLLLVPAGLGGHADHRIVALAAALLGDTEVPVGFYEDRPYVAYLDPEGIDAQLAPLGVDLEVRPVSGQVTAATQRRVRRCYPSQIDSYFVEAMERDLASGAVERVWFPVGTAPDWFR